MLAYFRAKTFAPKYFGAGVFTGVAPATSGPLKYFRAQYFGAHYTAAHLFYGVGDLTTPPPPSPPPPTEEPYIKPVVPSSLRRPRGGEQFWIDWQDEEEIMLILAVLERENLI